VRLARDLRRAAQLLELVAGFVQAHVVQHVIERYELLRRVAAVAGLGRAQPVDPSHHALIEVCVRAHGVVHARAVLEQPGQDLVDIGDRKRIVRAVIPCSARRTRTPPVPGLARRIAIAHEQNVLGLGAAGHQHGYGLGLTETREIVEIAVLPEGIFDIAVAVPDGRRGQHRDRVAPHETHQLAAAAREFVPRHA